ncbi:MAG: ABC transporter ATP-binding protein [Acidimicrobiales bacterium]
MTAAAAISVTGLTKRYKSRTVVDALDLELPTGVVAGLVGPNGAGKTTTMAMLLGLVRPSGGRGSVLGTPLATPSRYLRRVGALIESPAFYPALSGAENLRTFAIAGGHDPEQVDLLIDVVGLSGRGDDRYRSYSLGMKQRLGIAGALLGEPELLILDEPANGLDPEGVSEMRGLIGGLAHSGRTVLVSSHDLSELEQMCDWLVLIDKGRCAFAGPTSELLDGSTTGLLAAPPRTQDLPALQDLLIRAGHHVSLHPEHVVIDVACATVAGSDVADLAARVNQIAFEAGIVLSQLSPVRSSLEDRYLNLIKGTSS